jgi:hypothetical protein
MNRHYEDDPADRQAEDVAAVLRGLVPCHWCHGRWNPTIYVYGRKIVCGLCHGDRWVVRSSDD